MKNLLVCKIVEKKISTFFVSLTIIKQYADINFESGLGKNQQKTFKKTEIQQKGEKSSRIRNKITQNLQQNSERVRNLGLKFWILLYTSSRWPKTVSLKNALNIVDVTQPAASALSKINGVRVIGRPQLCVISFQIDIVDCYSVSSQLAKQKKMENLAFHLLKALHVSITPENCENVKRRSAADTSEAIDKLKSELYKEASTAALYGANATFPSEQMLRKILTVTFK